MTCRPHTPTGSADCSNKSEYILKQTYTKQINESQKLRKHIKRINMNQNKDTQKCGKQGKETNKSAQKEQHRYGMMCGSMYACMSVARVL